ncbi:MAG: hemin uptake protein HemP [Bacteroidota bacterium]
MNSVPNVPESSVLMEPEFVAAYDARELIKSGCLARILLDGQTYYLRITRAGKLILTK